MKNIFKTAALASLLVFGATSCTSDFEKINTDPDAYDTAPTANMLTYSLYYGINQYADNLPGIGLWCGYASNREYIDDYSDYKPTNNTYGNKWSCWYWSTNQMRDIIDRTDETGTKNMHLVAQTVQCFYMLWCTDAFGDIPYSQAFKGAPEDGGILKTPYDKQSDIYPAILEKLKSIADKWAAGYGDDSLGGANDILFGGKVDRWRRFVNSLRLRYAMRLSAVYPASQSIVEEILNNPSKYPVIETHDQNAYFNWDGGISSYYDRWYNTFYSRTDYCASQILIDHLKNQNDPRLSVIAKPGEDGEYRGGEHGYDSQSLSNNKMYSLFGTFYAGNSRGFAPLYRACETYFVEAEAAMKGWNVPMSAEAAYNKAVALSMEDNELDAATAEAYLAAKGKWDGSYDKLYTEWWIGLFKDNQEAWSLYRRTGYPKYISTAVSSQTGGKQYPGAKAYKVWGNDHNDVPFRMPYPDNQYTYNTENVEAAAAGVVDYCWGKQMWWDTRSGVK